MKITTLCYACTTLLCMLSPYPVFAAAIYKWTDADGTVQYSEQPPPQGAREIHIHPDTASATAHPPAGQHADPRVQRDKMIQAMEGDRRARQEKRHKQQQEQQKVKTQCVQAKDMLRQYKEAVSLYKLDSQGNRQIMPESAKQQETGRLEAEIKKWCK